MARDPGAGHPLQRVRRGIVVRLGGLAVYNAWRYLNALIQVAEDEMQAFGRVDCIVRELVVAAQEAPSQPASSSSQAPSRPVEIGLGVVLSRIEAEGLGPVPTLELAELENGTDFTLENALTQSDLLPPV